MTLIAKLCGRVIVRTDGGERNDLSEIRMAVESAMLDQRAARAAIE